MGNQVQTQPHYKLMVLLLPVLMIQISLLQVMHIGMVLIGNTYKQEKQSVTFSTMMIVGMFSVRGTSGSPGGTVTWTNQLVIDTTGAILTGIATITEVFALMVKMVQEKD